MSNWSVVAESSPPTGWTGRSFRLATPFLSNSHLTLLVHGRYHRVDGLQQSHQNLSSVQFAITIAIVDVYRHGTLNPTSNPWGWLFSHPVRPYSLSHSAGLGSIAIPGHVKFGARQSAYLCGVRLFQTLVALEPAQSSDRCHRLCSYRQKRFFFEALIDSLREPVCKCLCYSILGFALCPRWTWYTWRISRTATARFFLTPSSYIFSGSVTLFSQNLVFTSSSFCFILLLLLAIDLKSGWPMV